MAHAKTVNIIKPTDYERFNNLTLSVIQELEDEGRFGTAHVYRSMLRAFQRYWESEHPKTKYACGKCLISPRYTNSKGTCWRGCSS